MWVASVARCAACATRVSAASRVARAARSAATCCLFVLSSWACCLRSVRSCSCLCAGAVAAGLVGGCTSTRASACSTGSGGRGRLLPMGVILNLGMVSFSPLRYLWMYGEFLNSSATALGTMGQRGGNGGGFLGGRPARARHTPATHPPHTRLAGCRGCVRASTRCRWHGRTL